MATLAILVAALLLSLRVMQAVTLVAPLVVCLPALLRGGARPLSSSSAMSDAAKFVPECGGTLKDLTMYAVGFALTRALTDSGTFSAVAHAIAVLQAGPFVVAALLALALALALMGCQRWCARGWSRWHRLRS